MNLLKPVKQIIVHHSGRNFDSPFLIRMRHKYLRHWEDVGYHYMIGSGFLCQNGGLYSGRSDRFEGAHAIGFNEDSIGVCLVGNFDLRHPSQVQLETLFSFIASRISRYGISPDAVIGHRELPGVTKSCPGRMINMDEIREGISRRVGSTPHLNVELKL